MNANKISISIFFLTFCSIQISNNIYSASIKRERRNRQIALYNRMLSSAIINKDLDEAVEAIVDGANVNFKDLNLRTPLYYAAANNDLDMVKLLIKNGARVNSQDSLGYTPLITAVFGGYKNIVRFLLENGAYIYVPYGGEILDAIQFAAESGHRDIADLITNYLDKRQKEVEEITGIHKDLTNIIEKYEGYQK